MKKKTTTPRSRSRGDDSKVARALRRAGRGRDGARRPPNSAVTQRARVTRKAAPGGGIVAFCCENSAVKSLAPLAGDPLLRNVEVIQVPCAGRVEIRHMMRRIEDGARSVLVLGCPLDNCKYIHGNRRTAKRVERARKALEEAGLEPDRIRMAFLSSVDPHKLLNILKEMNAP